MRTLRPERTAQPAAEAEAEPRSQSLLETAAQEILAVSYWFEPAPEPGDPYPVTVRFSGRRTEVEGQPTPRDRFTQEVTLPEVVPGSGPVSITARVRDINPGVWAVTAQVQGTARPAHLRRRARKEQAAAGPPARPLESPERLGLLTRLWHRWAPSVDHGGTVGTCPAPFVHVPGLIPGIWGILVGVGLLVALLTQTLLIAHGRLAFGPVWLVWLAGIPAGVVGAKLWYAAVHPEESGVARLMGWCIQGFILGVALASALVLLLLRVPPGAFLDVTAPGLLFGMAIGRVGCFFAGCCGGPPTAARWGIWSSDQHIGARRVPTQLMESTLALSVALATLALVLARGPASGALFVGGMAAYTLVRQGILSLRAEQPRTPYGRQITAIVAALVLIGSVLWLILGA